MSRLERRRDECVAPFAGTAVELSPISSYGAARLVDRSRAVLADEDGLA